MYDAAQWCFDLEDYEKHLLGKYDSYNYDLLVEGSGTPWGGSAIGSTLFPLGTEPHHRNTIAQSMSTTTLLNIQSRLAALTIP